MSNSSVDYIDALSGPYFLWLEKDVFPIIFGVILLCILITGLVLNSLVIYAVYKKKSITINAKTIFIQLILLDFLAYIFVLVPSMIVTFAKDWILSEPVCFIHGIFVIICFIGNFIFPLTLCIERTMKLWQPRVYDMSFSRSGFGVVLSVLVWFCFIVIAILPFAGWDVMEYISYQHQCNVQYNNKANLNLMFTFVVCIPTVIVTICCILTIKKRRYFVKSLSKLDTKIGEINSKITKKNEDDKLFDKCDKIESLQMTETETKTARVGSTVIGRERTATPSQIHPMVIQDIDVIEEIDAEDDTSYGSVTTRSEKQMGEDMKVADGNVNMKLNKVKVAFSVYNSSAEQQEVTLTVSYILMFIVILGLWLPYIALTYVKTYDVINLWGGWFTLVLILCDVSYCIKPIVYLSHNKILQKAAINTVPESLRKRVSRAQIVLRKTIQKVDDVGFVKPSDTKTLIEV